MFYCLPLCRENEIIMGEYVDTTKGGERKTERSSGRLTTKTKVDMNSRSFKSAVTRAARYTDDNYHSLAGATMAKAFGYNDMEKEYSDIEKRHVRAGSLTQELYERRNKADNEMEKRIKRDYGEQGIRAWNKAK